MSTLSWNSVSEINGDHGIELRDIKHKEEEEEEVCGHLLKGFKGHSEKAGDNLFLSCSEWEAGITQ